MTAPDPPPVALRDLLAGLIAQGLKNDCDGFAYYDIGEEDAVLDGHFDLRNVADAILSDPRIAVIQLPEAVNPEFSSGPLGFFWTNPEAATELAAQLLAAAVNHNNINRGEPS